MKAIVRYTEQGALSLSRWDLELSKRYLVSWNQQDENLDMETFAHKRKAKRYMNRLQHEIRKTQKERRHARI